ncbi:T4 family baseplate hub assembly chaperone [Streptomyces pratensis]|uniref:T4 family baseplate hub assembly chaperone n=1 Tax=Streptomyces pratensis TaxID=1169025 RepID=UPI003645B16F
MIPGTAPVGPAELLGAWEAGLALGAAEKSLLLHRAARPGAGTDELLSVPVGEREADLFALRRSLFGERMQVRVECGACGEAMEFDLDAGALGARPTVGDRLLRVAEDDWAVEFRLPTVADLTAAGAAGTPADARRRLVTGCTVRALRGGEPVAPERLAALLPGRVERLIAEKAAEADPAAEVTLNVACPDCGEATPAELDITSYLWTELDSWARDLLLDVHLLATAYGWSEPDILALSPLRRRYYLELCTDG